MKNLKKFVDKEKLTKTRSFEQYSDYGLEKKFSKRLKMKVFL